MRNVSNIGLLGLAWLVGCHLGGESGLLGVHHLQREDALRGLNAGAGTAGLAGPAAQGGTPAGGSGSGGMGGSAAAAGQGAAGAAAMGGATALAGAPASAGAAGAPRPPDPPARVPCPIDTPYVGDEQRLCPPAQTDGMQIHIGPLDYQNAEEIKSWLLQPGEEKIHTFTFRTPNTSDITYSEWEFSSRPGLHSLYVSILSGEEPDRMVTTQAIGRERVIGQLPAALTMSVPRRPAAPENAAVGVTVPARFTAAADIHVYNFTDQPLLIEAWFNLYYPRATPIQRANFEQFVGGAEFQLQPKQTLTKAFACPIAEPGRLLSLRPRGTLATSISLDAWLRRSTGERLQLIGTNVVDNTYDFPFDSVTINPPLTEPIGARSGVVEFNPGDTFEWSCEWKGDSTEPSQAFCDLTGLTVGAAIGCEAM